MREFIDEQSSGNTWQNYGLHAVAVESLAEEKGQYLIMNSPRDLKWYKIEDENVTPVDQEEMTVRRSWVRTKSEKVTLLVYVESALSSHILAPCTQDEIPAKLCTSLIV
jgi:hypothetical protein